MTDNQLIHIDPNAAGNSSELAGLMSGGKYLPRIQLMTDKSDAVSSGKFPKNHWALIPDAKTMDDLGENLDIIPIAFRAKALRVGETVETSYDVNSVEFKDIVAEADSNPGGGGCMYGPSVLIWLPEVQKFAELFLISKSARRQGTAIRERLGRGVTLKPAYIKTAKYSWWAFDAVACDSITPDQLPTAEQVKEESDKFCNPPVQEKAPEAAAGRDR